jgi:CRP/FNR family cyclic AMP-dependent transcriptional regulator
MNAIRKPGKAPAKIAPKNEPVFDVQAFLDSSGAARRIVEYERLEKIYAQGDHATTVFYIQRGAVKLTTVNEAGKEAVVAMLGPGDFFGEGGIAGQLVRMGAATTITPTTLLAIEKKGNDSRAPR